MGLYSEAAGLMQRAVQLAGMGHPLACRAAGVMTYLYDQGKDAKERSLVCAEQGCTCVMLYDVFPHP